MQCESLSFILYLLGICNCICIYACVCVFVFVFVLMYLYLIRLQTIESMVCLILLVKHKSLVSFVVMHKVC